MIFVGSEVVVWKVERVGGLGRWGVDFLKDFKEGRSGIFDVINFVVKEGVIRREEREGEEGRNRF